ncbi:MAG: hypothetical protein H6737_24305 [Alphaproteobacteria bacterium]|nr:hypothetical protein [Alphaproteobacteria bacterium]
MKLFLVFGLACVPVSVARATTMVVMDVHEQADESHALVEAVVGGSVVVQTERMVYTDTELRIVDVLGGEAPRTITVRQAGGVLPERTVFIAGDARLAAGERIVAFVRERDSRWYFTALGQSVWHVEDGHLAQDLLTEHLMERDRLGRVGPATQSPLAFDAIDDLVEAVSDVPFGGAL